jgi:hypothetical protein
MFSVNQLDQIKRDNPCHVIAAQWVTLRRKGKGYVGPCPIHSPDPTARDSTGFECSADGWMCAVCQDGGDVIKLVMRREGIEFPAAVERLGGAKALDAENVVRLEEERARKRAKAEESSKQFREKARETAFDIWQRGRPIEGTPAERYLALRLGAEWPPIFGRSPLRVIEDMPYWADGSNKSEEIWRGPALLAPIVRGGRFAGVHLTYIDLAQPKGKLALSHPQTGVLLPAKKVRGSLKGGHIELISWQTARRLIIGEGIEKVLAAAYALSTPSNTDFWTAVDLGNLGGKAATTVAHPTAKTPAGRPQRIPGPEPDLTEPGVEIPDSVEEIVILGDMSSDRYLTMCAIRRAAARWEKPGRVIKVAWSSPLGDFDDELRIAADRAAACRSIAENIANATLVEMGRPLIPIEEASSAAAPPPVFFDAKNESPPATLAGENESRGLQGAPADLDKEERREDAIRACAELDESDVANGERLRRYFGRNLLAVAQTGQAIGAFLRWSGRHWDFDNGVAGAHILAQQVGELIIKEADFIKATEAEQKIINEGKEAQETKAKLAIDQIKNIPQIGELEARIKKAKAVLGGLMARQENRRAFGQQTRNYGRIEQMLKAAGPHMRYPPDAFNTDTLLIATHTHTLRLVRERDLDCPDPAIERYTARVEAVRGHRRSNLLTAAVPVDYKPDAEGPKWQTFLARCLPQLDKRRMVQVFSGLGLTGLPIQRLMYHTGSGANGKSVYLETITRLLGDSFAVGLPVESIIGMTSGSGSQASPDIARLFGKRMLRVHELPQGALLKAETIKKLTGGERMTARDLYKGFFEFQPRAKVHMRATIYPPSTAPMAACAGG